MESYDSWPLMNKFTDLNLTPELKKIEKKGVRFTNFLPAAYSTFNSSGSIITSIPYTGVNISKIGANKSGYAEDLSEAQVAALAEIMDKFKHELESEAGQTMCDRFGGQQRCLLRFLRVCSFKVEDTLTRLKATLAWRTEVKADSFSEVRSPVCEKVLPWWPGGYCGTAKDGCPIQYFKVNFADPGHILRTFSEEELKEFYIYWMETSLRLQRESIAHRKEAGEAADVKGTIEIYDLTACGRTQLHLPGLNLLAKILAVGTAHYPSNLWKGFVLQTPYIFSWGWKIITPILHAQTRERIKVDSHGCETELEAAIDKEHLVKVFACVANPKEMPTIVPDQPGDAGPAAAPAP